MNITFKDIVNYILNKEHWQFVAGFIAGILFYWLVFAL